VHPNWPQVIYPLRVGLAKLGWTTLSLQMPILPNEATNEEYIPLFPEVAPRIDAGLALLADHDLLPTVIVAHSMGANMASFYLRDARSGGSVAGFVGIGMSGRSNGGNNDIATSLGLIDLPVLDLYGDRDLKTVLDSVDRRFAAGSVNRHYEQRIARNSNHFFDDTSAELLALVDEWLATKTLP
jgi:pimeloyl-ACP methyl ester carboxylesterase